MFAARIAVALLATSTLCFAQTMGTGTIAGTVTDASAAVVPDVKVTAIDLNTGTGRTVLTNAGGSYVIPALQIGRYQVKAVHEGFKAVTQEDVRVDVDSTITVNFSLQIGSAEQSVTVTAAPPALQTIERRDRQYRHGRAGERAIASTGGISRSF